MMFWWPWKPKPKPKPPAQPMRGLEDQLLALHNEIRSQARLTPFRVDLRLNAAAQNAAAWCADKGLLSHYTANGASAFDRMRDQGYEFAYAGENACEGATTPDQAMQIWLGSIGHRSNILKVEFVDVGFGVAVSTRGNVYWFVDFGSSA